MVKRGECAACAAKDQTILVLSDQVDYLRGLIAGQRPVLTVTEPGESRRLWVTDEEEEIELAASMGVMTEQQKLEALAMAQVSRATVQEPT